MPRKVITKSAENNTCAHWIRVAPPPLRLSDTLLHPASIRSSPPPPPPLEGGRASKDDHHFHMMVDPPVGGFRVYHQLWVLSVLHGESSKRLATPRNTKDKKHLCYLCRSAARPACDAHWIVSAPRIRAMTLLGRFSLCWMPLRAFRVAVLVRVLRH